MTCEDCLAALATESLRDISPDSPLLQHCATCPDCARVTTTLRENEYEAATILNSLPPMSNPLTVAETAVRIAQRRRIGRVVVMFSGAALAATIWIAAATTIIPALNRGDLMNATAERTETIPLKCLSPRQAADIIDPYVRSNHSKYWIPGSGISAITVHGTRDELAKSRDLIWEFEKDPNAACRMAPTTLLGEPGEALLDLKAPAGTGPTIPPGKATTVPKKE